MIGLTRLWRGWCGVAASFLLVLMALPGSRHFLEASMSRHMLLQFPLLMLAGYALAASLPDRWAGRLNQWNVHGISGLFAVALLLAVLMIPRVLDLALVDGRIELAKWLALLIGGAALRHSWRPAEVLVQGFFLGNILPMMAVVGYLFESSPVRLCNAYLLDDQKTLGQGLVWIALMIGGLWFTALVRAIMRKEATTPVSDSRKDS